MDSNDSDHRNELIGKILDLCSKKSLKICFICLLRFVNVRQLIVWESREQAVKFCRQNFKNEIVNSLLNVSFSDVCHSCLNLFDDEYLRDASREIVEKTKDLKISEFQLHIHLPNMITLRHMYFSHVFGIDPTDVINLKDILRTFLTDRIEKLIQAKYVPNASQIIEVEFEHEKNSEECSSFQRIFSKRSKCQLPGSFINHTSLRRLFDQLDHLTLDRFDLEDLEGKTCKLLVITKLEPIFIAGRYLKYSRNLSQTPWFLNDENQFMSSVQDRIIAGVSQFIQSDYIKFSAAGREDVDVRMLGNGRPFLLEIVNPKWDPDVKVIEMIKRYINETFQDVNVRDLQFVEKVQSQAFLKQGEQEKSKTYRAMCCLNRPFTTEDQKKLNEMKDMVIQQRTPIRVLHRRSVTNRPRTIHKIDVEPAQTSDLSEEFHPHLKNCFKMDIVTEAGTYIKEFVHSDFGRTVPNVGQLLGNDCSADIISLDVIEVKLDWPPIIN